MRGGREFEATLAFGFRLPGRSPAEIAGGGWVQQYPCDEGADQTMHEELMQGIEGAEDDVECNPCKRQPSCPVLSAEHENAADDCQTFGECDPETVVLQRDDFAKMVGEAHDADCDVDAGENRDRDGAWVFGHGSFPYSGLTIPNACSGWNALKRALKGRCPGA